MSTAPAVCRILYIVNESVIHAFRFEMGRCSVIKINHVIVYDRTVFRLLGFSPKNVELCRVKIGTDTYILEREL